jgi:hypothetical protein
VSDSPLNGHVRIGKPICSTLLVLSRLLEMGTFDSRVRVERFRRAPAVAVVQGSRCVLGNNFLPSNLVSAVDVIIDYIDYRNNLKQKEPIFFENMSSVRWQRFVAKYDHARLSFH